MFLPGFDKQYTKFKLEHILNHQGLLYKKQTFRRLLQPSSAITKNPAIEQIVRGFLIGSVNHCPGIPVAISKIISLIS